MSQTKTTSVPSVKELIAMTYTGDVEGWEYSINFHDSSTPSTTSTTSTPSPNNVEVDKKDLELSEKIPMNSSLDVVSGGPKMTKQEAEEMKKIEKEYKESLIYIKDIIAPSMMKIDAKKLQIGDTIVRTVFTYAYPDILEGNWLSPLINWDVKFDMSMFVYPVDSTRVMKFLRTRLTQLRSQSSINREK